MSGRVVGKQLERKQNAANYTTAEFPPPGFEPGLLAPEAKERSSSTTTTSMGKDDQKTIEAGPTAGLSLPSDVTMDQLVHRWDSNPGWPLEVTLRLDGRHEEQVAGKPTERVRESNPLIPSEVTLRLDDHQRMCFEKRRKTGSEGLLVQFWI